MSKFTKKQLKEKKKQVAKMKKEEIRKQNAKKKVAYDKEELVRMEAEVSLKKEENLNQTKKLPGKRGLVNHSKPSWTWASANCVKKLFSNFRSTDP